MTELESELKAVRAETEKRQVLQLIDAFIERGALKRKAQCKAGA